MQKLKLVGLKSEDAEIFDVLTRSGLFEPRAGEEVCGTEKSSDSTRLDSILSKQAKCAFAISFITGAVKEAAKKAKKNHEYEEYTHIKTGGVTETAWADILKSGQEEAELLDAAADLERLSFIRTEIKTKRNKMNVHIRALSVYEFCGDKFSSFISTEKCNSVLVSGKYSAGFIDKLYAYPVCIEEYVEKGYDRIYGLVYLKDHEDAMRGILADHGYSVCSFTYDAAPLEEIAKCRNELKVFDEEDKAALLKILSYAVKLPQFKLLYDGLYIEAEKAKARLGYYTTDETYILEGWLPKPEAERIVGDVKSTTDKIDVYLTDADSKENPPSLYKKNTVLAPYQGIADSYSPPAYGEFDPGPFTAFFFFLFFGMLTADAGYGLVLSLGALIIVKVLKPRGGFKSLVMLIGISAISAIIWGILFGSIFGLDYSQLGGLFGLEAPPAIWFNPLDVDNDGPMMLLIISLLVGVLHLTCGYCLHFYKQTKAKHLLDAIFDDGLMIVAYAGVFMLLLWMGVGLLNVKSLPAWFEIFLMPGLICLGVGIGGVILTKGRKKKGVLGKIVSGASGLYELINILSDVLSYARIFGIALASCAIGLAFNTLIELVAGAGPIGIIFAVVMAVVLHLFNLAMGVLSAYVHNARLQYLEFFGKFYDGGGRLFVPLGSKTKYIIPRA